MHGRSKGTILTILAVTFLLMSGCLFDGLKNIVSLELTASDSTVQVSETIELSARGKTKTGKIVSVIPDWEIVAGAGTVGKSDFQASDWNYEGPVVLKATYNGVSSEIEININGLLHEYGDPFPKPISPWVALPSSTKGLTDYVEVGGEVDFFSDIVHLKEKNSITRGRARFVWDGKIMLPDDPSPAKWANSQLYDEIPERPRLSHTVHFELIEAQVLGKGTNFSKSVSHRQGTTMEQSQELVKRLTSETTAKAQWGWGEIETTLTAEITSKTQQSVKIEKEDTVTRTWSFTHPNDYDTYLYSSWNKVDTFFLSDSEGVPLEESEIFKGYGFHSSPVEVRGAVVVQKTWGFNN